MPEVFANQGRFSTKMAESVIPAAFVPEPHRKSTVIWA